MDAVQRFNMKGGVPNFMISVANRNFNLKYLR